MENKKIKLFLHNSKKSSTFVAESVTENINYNKRYEHIFEKFRCYLSIAGCSLLGSIFLWRASKHLVSSRFGIRDCRSLCLHFH